MATTLKTETQSSSVVLRRPPSRFLLLSLSAVAAALAVLHLLAEASQLEVLQSYFDMGSEATVPTWWSSVQLLALGFLFFLLASRESERDRRASRALYAGALLSVFFSLDEVATLHESVTGVLERFRNVPRFAGTHGIWILVYGAIGLGLLVWLLPGLISFFRAERRTALRILVGACVFLAGGVGIELVSYFSDPLVLLEETLEVVGVTIMVWAVYVALEGTSIRLATRDELLDVAQPGGIATRPRR